MAAYVWGRPLGGLEHINTTVSSNAGIYEHIMKNTTKEIVSIGGLSL